MTKPDVDELLRRARQPRTKEQEKGYARVCEAMNRAGYDWMRAHPFAQPRFRTEAFEAEVARDAGRPGQKPFIAAALDTVIDRWADNEDARALLRAMDAATGGEGTYMQARMVLDAVVAASIGHGQLPPGDWRCTGCARVIDGFSTSKAADGSTPVPTAGAMTVCAYCAAIQRVTATSSAFEPVSEVEVRALPKDLRMKLLAIRNAVNDRLARERKRD